MLYFFVPLIRQFFLLKQIIYPLLLFLLPELLLQFLVRIYGHVLDQSESQSHQLLLLNYSVHRITLLDDILAAIGAYLLT